MKELRNKIQAWLKDNKTEYYGLDRDSVDTALWEFENVLDKVEEMQKALEFYAEPDTYCIEHLNQFGYIIIDKDAGEIARQALKGVETE